MFLWPLQVNWRSAACHGGALRACLADELLGSSCRSHNGPRDLDLATLCYRILE